MAEDGHKGNGKKRRFAEVFSDLPVTGAKGLAFGFEGLARTLAELAQNPRNRTPFTVVVRGDWGRGKTTLMRQVERLLGEAKEEPGVRRVHTLWFNAWKYPSEETVLAGLLGALLDELRRGDLVDQLKLAVDERKDRLAKRVLKVAAPWLENLAEDGGRYSEAEERRAFYDAFRRLFAEAWYLWQHGIAALHDTGHRRIEDALRQREAGHALAIFLDDLDRCRESRVLEVMEAINLFLDLPGVCFYLGLDWKRMSQLLTNSMPGREEQFLEKIVQVSVDLSEVSESGVLDYAAGLVKGSSLADLLPPGEDGGALEALAGILKSNHPRHVKRVLNDLAMTLAILRNAGHLGEGDGRLPGSAVLGWHLLHEALPPAEWGEMRALRANVEGWLRRWGALDVAAEGGRAEISEEVLKLRRDQRLSTVIDTLAGLSSEQLDRLVHFGSPPREGPRAAPVLEPEADREAASGLAWVSLEGGPFRMGAEDIDDARPVHEVTLSPFKIARFPVTNAQYRVFVEDTGVGPPKHWREGRIPKGKENHPLVYVSWTDAKRFCTWLGERVVAEQGGTVRLPTEAEWEFAARGPEGRAYPWGNDEPTAQHANFDGNLGDTTPAGSYPKGETPTGVHDLAGNVWEWCADWYGQYDVANEHKPNGPESGERRVLRGAAFYSKVHELRAAIRNSYPPDYDYNHVGFRVVWSASQGPE